MIYRGIERSASLRNVVWPDPTVREVFRLPKDDYPSELSSDPQTIETITRELKTLTERRRFKLVSRGGFESERRRLLEQRNSLLKACRKS